MRSNPHLFLLCVMLFLIAREAQAQEVLGTTTGISQSSPPVLWPRGMSLEALSPENLYPNGSQFGLSNTSGGFGTTGSGPMSGVGLAQRSVSPLVQQELKNSSVFVNRLSIQETAERSRSQALFSNLISGNFRVEMSRPSLLQADEVSRSIIQPYRIPSADSILQDRAATPDSVLNSGL